MIQGFCSKCNKVWTLKEAQGVCQWCGKLAVSQTRQAQALRSFKSSRKRRQRQDDHNGNGYDQLHGEWLTYYKVASRFNHKAMVQDRDDLLHTIIVNLADVARNNGHKPFDQAQGKPFTEIAMYRIASLAVTHYWRDHYRLTNGLDCRWCSKEQRQKCRTEWLYSECPKAIRLQSMDKPIADDDGNLTDIGKMIADDSTLDLDAWLDAKTFLRGCPQRLIAIGAKIATGEKLTATDSQYLWRWRKIKQKHLIPM